MISVAVVSYNGEKYIGEQLDTILMNLGPEDEIVVSDDGSTDSTRQLLAEYQKRYPQMKVIEGPGQGVISNVENALKACSGDFIFLSDQDDRWMPDKVERVMAVFEREQAVLVVHDARVADSACQEALMPSFFAYRGSGKGAWKNIIKNTYMGCCMAFRREALEAFLPIPTDIQMHDQWIGVQCDLRFHRTVFLPEPLICYRRHEGNVSDFSRNSVWKMVRNRCVFVRRLLGHGRRKFIGWIGKALGAGIVSFGILSLFSAFYHNPPVHVQGENQATAYVRASNAFWSRGTEGFAWGRTDGHGYNNSYPAEEGPVDILMMGSSQTEGLYVCDDQCVSYLLNQKFSQGGDGWKIYNIGMSAHTFYRNISNLETALRVYQPRKYVAMETSVLTCAQWEADQIFQHSMPELELVEGNGLLGELQKNPYVKLMYQQYKNYVSLQTEEVPEESLGEAEAFDGERLGATEQILQYIARTADDYGCQAVIYFIPDMSVEEDGRLAFGVEESARGQFGEFCREQGILFIDMTEQIAAAYETEHRLASGFSNTTVGYGHLNAYGHALLADAIYEAVKAEEGR